MRMESAIWAVIACFPGWLAKSFVFPEPAKGKEAAAAPPALFASLEDDALLSIGVPADWLADVRAANEDGFFALAPHLPAEASEALLEFAGACEFSDVPNDFGNARAAVGLCVLDLTGQVIGKVVGWGCAVRR